MRAASPVRPRGGARAAGAALAAAAAVAALLAPPAAPSAAAEERALPGADLYATNEIFLPDLYSLKRKVQWEGGGGHKIVRTEHFEVVVREGEEELGLRVAGIAEPWYDELTARLGVARDSAFGARNDKRIPLIAYTSLPRFQETNTTPGFLPEGVQGFFEFIKGRIVLPHTGSNTLLEHVTRHEIVHACVFRIAAETYQTYRDTRRLVRERRGDWNRLSFHARRIVRGAPAGTFPRYWRSALHPKEMEIGLPNREAADAAAEGRALLAPRVYVGIPPGETGVLDDAPLTVSVQVVGDARLGALLEPAAFDTLAAALLRAPDSARLVIRRIERARRWDPVPDVVTLLDLRAGDAAAESAAVRAAIARALEPATGRWGARRPELAILAPPAASPGALVTTTAPLLAAYRALSAIALSEAPTAWPPPEEAYGAAEDSLFRWAPPSLKPRLLPLALNEGAAEYYGSDWDALEEMVLRDALYSGRLVPIQRLGPQHGYLVYVEGESFLRFLSRTHGEEAVSLLARSLYLGATLSDVTRALVGKDLATLSRDWEEDLRRRLFPRYADDLSTEGWAKRLTEGAFDTAPRASGARTLFKRARRGRTEIALREEGAGENAPPGVASERILARDRRPGSESLHLLQAGLDIRGDRVAFGVQRKGRDVLRVLDLPSARTAREHSWDDVLSITGVSIATDGRRAALTALDPRGHTDLFLVSLETGALTRVTEDVFEDASPDWGEGGILFSSDRESRGSHDLFRFDPDRPGTGIERLTETAWNETEPGWLPGGGSFLALDDREGVPNVLRFDVATGASRFVTRDRNGIAHAAVGEDRLVCAAFGGLRMRVYEAPLDSLLSVPERSEDSTAAAAATDAPDATTDSPATDSLPLAAWTLPPPPPHDVVPYRPRYGADILFLNATSLTSGGYLGFSDLLGNRQIALVLGSNAGNSESFVKFLNIGVVYHNLEGRNDWRAGFLRTGNEFLTEEEGFFFERDTGILFGMTHPLDRFRSVSWNLIASAVTRETPGEEDDRTAEVALQTVLGHDTAVPDDYGYGYGSGLLTSLLLSLDYRITQPTGWRSATAIYDLRHYLPIAGRTFLAARASYGLSSGRVPDRIRLGGSWTLRGFRFNDLQGDRFALGNLELRFPVPVVVSVGSFPIIRAVQGAIFGDVGDAWFESQGIRVKGSVGVGFRMGVAGTVVRYDISKRYDERKGGFQSGTRGDLFVGYNF